MAVKVFIKRRVKPDKLAEVSRLITQARYNAMAQQGYISSESYTALDDPHSIMVLSMWHDLADWYAYRESAQRVSHEAEIAQHLSESPTYEIYRLGLVPE
ncbi:MAG: antibiotic biosynthesis monooxygenase family protein [Desulfosarcinaceae bacterium]|nr:antibiotic biosynthesis monooxygenase family protein [Desulfosarcinaceae bacterium]